MTLQPSANPNRVLGTPRAALAGWAAAWRQTGAPSVRLSRKALGLDLCERVVVSALFFNFLYWMFSGPTIRVNLVTVLLALGEALPFVFILMRPPSITLSQRPVDWCFGLLGAILPLLVRPVANVTPVLPVVVCLCIMVAGISIQIAAKLALGRAFGIVAANRGVRVRGPYRLVRHPMYAGYTLTHVGFLLAMPSAMNALFYAAALAMQVARIHREELVLARDPAYRDFAGRVRYRLLPGVF